MKNHAPGELFQKFQKAKMKSEFMPVKKAVQSKKKAVKLVPPSKGHKPKGAHGRAAVRALGRTKTTGNFARIAAAKGKGAAIAAYQNALAAHKHKKKMTQAQDDAYDRKHGIKEGSARDIAQDRKNGIKDKKRSMKKTMCKKHHKVMCKSC